MIYIAEVSTPFLHLSWLLKQQVDIRRTAFAKLSLTVCGICLLLTFFVGRVLLGPYLFYSMVLNWTTGPEYLFLMNCGVVLFFILMNMYWFFQLVKILVFSGTNKKPKKSL